MASWFTRAIDKITPWNRGGEVQRNQEAAAKKKKKEEEQASNNLISVTRPKQNVTFNNQQSQPQAQTAQNLFAGLRDNLKLPSQPNNNVQVQKNANATVGMTPKPGTVIKPDQPALGNVRVGVQKITRNGETGTMVNNHFVPDMPERQDNRFWQKVGRGFKTAGKTAVGTVANIPEVGLAVGRAATGIVQGATEIPHLVTAALATGTEKLNEIPHNRFTSALNTGAQALNTKVKTATNVVNTPINAVNRGLDSAAKAYERNVPMAAGGEKAYKATQIPINVLAALLTLGGSTAAEGAANTSKVARALQLFNKPLTSNADNIIARMGQTVSNKVTPVVKPLFTPFKSTKTGVTKLINGRNVPTVERGAVEAGQIGNVLTDAQLKELSTTKIPVRQGIDINAPVSEPVRIPVRNTTPQGPIIREIGGDAPNVTRMPTPDEIAAQRAAKGFDNQVNRPDMSIEGVAPATRTEPYKLVESNIKKSQDEVIDEYAKLLKDLGEGNGVNILPDGTRASNNFRNSVTKSKRMTKQAWRDEAERQIKSGEAPPELIAAYNDATNPEIQSLLAKGEQAPVPEGRPIQVKQVNGINVIDKTDVPQNLPETPGTVRATVQTSPMAVKSNTVANTPIASTVPSLPAEVQAVLANPKQYTKRQVAAARNQRKLAKQLAKTKADTQSVIDNSPQLAPKPEGNPGFVPTGEFRRGENGNISEVAHQSTEAAQAATDTANLSAADVLVRANQDIAQGGRVTPESVRNLQAMLDSGRFVQTSPEYRAIAKTLYGAGSDYGRGLSLFNPTLRRTASGDQLANRFISKLYGVAEDGNKFTDTHYTQVIQAENKFADARDAANQALDRYNATKDAGDFATWKKAQQIAGDAEKESLITEYRVANDVLKGNKSPEALKAIQQAEKDAGVYQMDWIDANMLSGTGTFVRNYVNTSLVRIENRLFGGRGYSSKGAKIGDKLGNRSVVTDVKARNELDQNILSKTIKQWSTTGNTLGEGNIRAVGSARSYKYYSDQLKAKGVTGDQLARDTEVMMHTDPDGMVQHYEQWALSENALSGMAHSKKIEQTLVDAIASKGGGKLSQTAAKALVRLTVGFPTVIGRSLVGGVKRAALGLPDLGVAGYKFAKGDTQAMKDALYAAKVHAGSGATLYALGYGLAEAGLISPSYPSDPAERARWKAEGIQPNSIKIMGQWFNIPGYFGALALPLVIPANIMNKTSPGDIMKGVISGIQDLSPTSGIVNFVNGMEGRGGDQWLKNEITSLTRAVTPVGALLNQLSKVFDSTKNDTTTKDAIGNLLDSIASGIPGVNNVVNKIPATDDNGNVLHNPNPAATVFGAQGSDQPQGQQDVQQAQNAANDTYKQLSDYGVLQDSALMSLVDNKIQAQIQRGQDLTPEQITSVQKAITKGVTASGEDTAYLENGQYDTNLAVLKVKKDLMDSDPTTKPSDLAKMDTAIKRGEIYKEGNISYDMISAYQGTGVDEWRKMGIPPEDKNYDADIYDPEMYQKLWEIDQKMSKAGVSYKTGSLDKPKYTVKKAAAGNGSGSRSIDTSFGTLKAGTGAPTVKQYDTIDIKSGNIPHISVVRPNIVHKISSN